MYLSYVIGVCTEHLELENLLIFLGEVRLPQEEVVVVVDSGKATPEVRSVIEKFQWVKSFDREFSGDFAEHKNYFSQIVQNDYIFNIDADEIPQEFLIHAVRQLIGKHDLIAVPRINLCPGYTQDFLKKHKFSCNEYGFINWPDYQGRVYHRNLKWIGNVHEKIDGAQRPVGLRADPKFALWHVKTTTKQNKQNELYDKIIKT